MAQVPEFDIAHQLGEQTFRTGVSPQKQFGASSGISVELNLVNQALTARNISGAKISALYIAPPGGRSGIRVVVSRIKAHRVVW